MLKVILLKKLVIIFTITMVFALIVMYSQPFELNSYNFIIKKIDWTNYTFLQEERQRSGVGEFGKKVILESEAEKNLSLNFIKQYSYNVIVSDKISLDRALPDSRNIKCFSMKYRNDLPPISVIIVFHDEYLSFLLRTVHSIINRTPNQLLQEILLIDDNSSKGFLGVELDQHVNQYFKDKVRIIRLTERHGLMRARMRGIKEAKSHIVVVMDAHIEVNTNWLPPLIEPVFENSHVMTQPLVDYIDWNTLEYKGYPDYTGGRGAFNWHLTYIKLKRNLISDERIEQNYPVPVILGAIFATNKHYFWELGGYDPGLKIWGGEQYELSWKVWMCGGTFLNVPCSRVGHNYKGSGFHPYTGNTSFILPNLKRVAEVWMDEYKHEFYAHSKASKYNAGDLTEQIALRKRLGCKSFKWYLETILPDLLDAFPIDLTDMVAYGVIQSNANTGYCVDKMGANNINPIGLYPCASNLTSPQETQFFLYTKNHEIRFKSSYDCWDSNLMKIGEEKLSIQVYGCHGSAGNQLFKYNLTSQQIIGPHHSCLEADFKNISDIKLYLSKCDVQDLRQKWTWGYLNQTAYNLLYQ